MKYKQILREDGKRIYMCASECETGAEDIDSVDEVILELSNKNDKLKEDNMKLRKIYWLNHGCSFHDLYGDDGEMQCSKCMIDFKRDSIDEITDKLVKKRVEELK